VFICDFNKEINVKPYFRYINGKMTQVRGSKRSLLRLQDAIDDLHKKSTIINAPPELAYNFNPKSGKISKLAFGTSDKVNVKVSDRLNRPHYILHTHPDSSALSIGDIKASDPKTVVFAINKNGSEFRVRKLIDFDKTKVANKTERLYKNVVNYIRDTQNGKFYKHNVDQARFLTTHIQALQMRDLHMIHYRFRLGVQDELLVGLHNRFINSIVKDARSYVA